MLRDVTGDALRFDVVVEGGADQLVRMIDVDRRLQPVTTASAIDASANLHYRWR